MSSLPQCEALLLKKEGARLYVTFNRPERRNAINNQMAQEIAELVSHLEQDSTIRVVILRGAGGNFCAGGDIKERKALSDNAAPGTDPAYDRNYRSGMMFVRMSRIPQTLIAVVEGAAMGGGFGYACLADITIMHQEARLGMPETTLGIAPAQISPYVVKRIGKSEALHMALTARRINGEEAHRLGISHYLCADDQALEETIETVVSNVEKCGPIANAVTKEIISKVGTLADEDMVKFAAQKFAEMNGSEEGKEGHAAFVEKRQPVWPSLEKKV
ncbi:MAG TPA: enoyl-CoA hydratase [Gammaproteobacteria bacterium]|nr:enoyl-CoA hydratase [Gammaproteobacteria bacterium]